MAYRDNTKETTPTLKACTPGGYGQSSTLNNIARPGRQRNKVPGGAGSVQSVNGQTPRPGYKQFKPAGGGFGSIARPGGHQKIDR
jgi:hypothetical protein